MNTEGAKKLWGKYKFVAAVLLAGVALLLWPSGSEELNITDSGGTPENRAALQQEMEEILESISGVGKTRVMLMVDTDGERQLARDTELRYSGETAAPEEYSRSTETVLVDGNSGDETVVTKTLYPTYRGALVVCQGGDRAEVRLAVTEAVAALTGLSADRITVAKGLWS